MSTIALARSVTTKPFDRRQMAGLGGAVLGFFVVALDAQIVNVALPDIGAATVVILGITAALSLTPHPRQHTTH
jgi:hypothetical protein